MRVIGKTWGSMAECYWGYSGAAGESWKDDHRTEAGRLSAGVTKRGDKLLTTFKYKKIPQTLKSKLEGNGGW